MQGKYKNKYGVGYDIKYVARKTLIELEKRDKIKSPTPSQSLHIKNTAGSQLKTHYLRVL